MLILRTYFARKVRPTYAARRSAGIAPEVILRILLHAGYETLKILFKKEKCQRSQNLFDLNHKISCAVIYHPGICSLVCYVRRASYLPFQSTKDSLIQFHR